ncbi:MAG: hypothetical protein K9J06_12435 [Flavobacteriales bacterium]|nr:hypothetical protein [Flavobacteriales bacterium]
MNLRPLTDCFSPLPALMVAGLLLTSIGCTEKQDEVALSLHVRHHVDGTALSFDTLVYVNASNNLYSVTRLQYYLHGIRFIGSPGQDDYEVTDAFLVDGRELLEFDLGKVPVGEYLGISLIIGLHPDLNCTGCLPPTTPNVEMAWPDLMGGGYHFMKFEGHFKADGGAGNQHGFAIHLGNNGTQGQCSMDGPFTVTEEGGTVELSYNLNEVFHDPNTYDMDTLTYTMGNMPAMVRVAANLSNAFSFTFAP